MFVLGRSCILLLVRTHADSGRRILTECHKSIILAAASVGISPNTRFRDEPFIFSSTSELIVIGASYV